jgi:adenine-specific DNA-methyltransferase
MKNRLEVARDLLSEDGVIFVQCDDSEQAYLKVLMDEIFDRKDFIGSFIWKKKSGGGNDSKYIVNEHELILTFSKNKTNIENWYELHDEKYLKRYKENDKKGRYFWDTFARPGLKSPINYEIDAPDGTTISGDWIWSPLPRW